MKNSYFSSTYKGKCLSFCFLFLLGIDLAHAQGDSIAFDGDFYKKVSEDLESAIQIVEYIPQREEANNWTRKLAFRHYSHLTDARAAGAMLDATLKQDPANNVEQSVARNDGNESVVSYLRWPEDSSYMEYQVIRYLKLKNVKGLVTYQFTYRFKPMEKPGDASQIGKDRKRWQDALLGSKWPPPAAFMEKP